MYVHKRKPVCKCLQWLYSESSKTGENSKWFSADERSTKSGTDHPTQRCTVNVQRHGWIADVLHSVRAADPKGYVLYDPIYVTLWKRQDCGCQRAEQGVGLTTGNSVSNGIDYSATSLCGAVKTALQIKKGEFLCCIPYLEVFEVYNSHTLPLMPENIRLKHFLRST